MRIEATDVLKATNGGLDILLMLYPHINSCVGTTKKFKLRSDDKTASANIILKDDGNWIITDFGGGARVSRNGIQWFVHETGLTWVEALSELAGKFDVAGTKVEVVTVKPSVTAREATTEEKEGFGVYELNTGFTDFEIETIFSKGILKEIGWFKGEEKKEDARKVIETACNKYNFYSVKSYVYVKDRKHLTFGATSEYPIFLIDEGSFKKLYMPLHSDKGRRFAYIGGDKKPKDFVHGLAQAKSEFSKRMEDFLTDDPDYDNLSEADKKERRKDVEKLNSFVLCSGGSDALNLAVLGYWVGWMNSETAKLQSWDYSEIVKVADKVYQLQDIDDTGKQAAHELALQYLDIYTIELPEDLKEKLDRRYNPCKDLRDFFNHFSVYDFKELVKIALPYRFWEMIPEYMGRGENRVKVGYKYELDNVQAYNFLSKNGFFRLAIEGEKDEYVYVQIEGNIVKETKPVKVKNYIHEFLKARKMEKDLRNKLYNSTRLNESSLSNLPETDIDFTDNDEKRQLFFFSNCTWEVSAAGIKSHSPGAIKNFVWEKNVIEHHAKVLDPSFTITKDESGEYNIEIHNQNCMFLQLLIQTSRIHWRKELEDEMTGLTEEEAGAYKKANHINIAGPKLSLLEQKEQKQHLINKIFCIGHLLHRYKDPSRGFSIIGMDNKINDDGGSHGGSGKSIILEVAMQKIWKNTFTIPGTSPKVTENPHIYGGLTKHHQYIYMDDMDKYMKFRFFYPLISGDQPVNPKNAMGYVLPFKDVPKVAFTTNFTLIDQSPSSQRRVNYLVCSDYYHIKGEFSDYKEGRDPKNDLGKGLFTDFKREEWNLFYNTMARCLEFYLTTPDIIEPPMDNVSKRNLQTTMGLNFEAWAAVYFSEGSSNIDRLIPKEEAFEEFNKKNKSLNWSTQKFTSAVKAFCHYHGYELNPMELRNTKEGRIIHRVEERELRKDGWVLTGKLKATEFMYIQTDVLMPINGEVPGKQKELPI
jgi:hypothetical protein